MRKPSIRLGLTGGIASGKSTVSAMLATLGSAIIDADDISRAVTAKGGPAVGAIREHFGRSVMDADGHIDRGRLRQIVFSHLEHKAALEAIVHPIVQKAIGEQATAAEQLGAPCIVFDIPLLVETGAWRHQLHRILVVDCTQSTQIARLKQRNGMNQSEVEKIFAAQASRTHRLAAADAVLFNDGISFAQLEGLVTDLAPEFGL